MSNENSLFVCMTPLQMKIAERIICEKKIIDYKVICLFLAKSEKYVYYFDKIKKNSRDSFFYYPKEKAKGISLLKDVYVYKRQLLKSEILVNVKNVYAASIDNRYIQLIASILNNTNFYTFDDGLANLNYNGSYYKNEELSRIREFLWGIIGVDFFVQNFRKRSKIHYSIYQDKKNIIDMVENISLFNGVKYKNSDVRGEINIFLGQPLYEVNVLADNEYINNVLKKLNINMYFPHPRENYIIDGNLDVIKSNLIFEDYILEFFEKNEQLININIYTFFSTAVLNLSNLYFINTYIVYDSKFNKDIYDIFGSFSVKYIFLNGI